MHKSIPVSIVLDLGLNISSLSVTLMIAKLYASLTIFIHYCFHSRGRSLMLVDLLPLVVGKGSDAYMVLPMSLNHTVFMFLQVYERRVKGGAN